MSQHHPSKPTPWQPHRDWRVIVAAVVMLIAMITYVLTLDESIVPGPLNSEAPADTPPSADAP